jgi:hypothetical protein
MSKASLFKAAALGIGLTALGAKDTLGQDKPVSDSVVKQNGFIHHIGLIVPFASYHSEPHFHQVNPGFAPSYEVNIPFFEKRKMTTIATAGWYRNSFDANTFLIGGAADRKVGKVLHIGFMAMVSSYQDAYKDPGRQEIHVEKGTFRLLPIVAPRLGLALENEHMVAGIDTEFGYLPGAGFIAGFEAHLQMK